MFELHEKEGAVTFKVRVQPRASKTELVGEHGGALKLRLAAPPVDGKANAECRKFLAKLFQVPAGVVEILTGATAREKLIRIHTLTKSHALKMLAEYQK